MLNSRQKEESRPRSGGRKVRASRGVEAAGDTGVWGKTSGPRVPTALRTLPPPRPIPTRGAPLGSPCVPRTPLPFTMSTAPLPHATRVRRALALRGPAFQKLRELRISTSHLVTHNGESRPTASQGLNYKHLEFGNESGKLKTAPYSDSAQAQDRSRDTSRLPW